MSSSMVSSAPAAASPAVTPDLTFRAVQRHLAAILPTAEWMDAPTALELASFVAQDPPRLVSATLLEGKSLRAHEVTAEPAPWFSGFLDGTQASRVIAYLDGVPIVHGTVAAVVRERLERRMRTWNDPIVRRAVYAPVALLSRESRRALAAMPATLVDTTPEDARNAISHPLALLDLAVHAIQDARESAERALAEQWCRTRDDGLFVDGSITGSERVATSSAVVGVVKSHRTLYAEGDALHVVLRLRRGERTSVFRITSPRRTPVASWYLRLRDATGREPLFGLVRIEVPDLRDVSAKDIAARANACSLHVLAEALPLAVPDGRWDKMVYGVRDCEEFLRAIQ